MNSIRPLKDRVLIEPLKEEINSTLVIPDSIKNKSTKGLIISKGSKVSEDLNIGDKVYFTEFAGMEIKLHNEIHILMKEMEILGKEN